ncbi:hypothetical protein QMM96_22625 [Citrobacter freundii]|uniref:hypothetical protein n=1 Tax=Citrobacter freundii TaxID=546 RepID=UPI002B24C206|nr:hypothetical protein [Citrobacter freundii]MEB2478229.1 hypothetical protein [Citrobacter freundii]
MAKSALKYLVRAWNKELKLPEWKMGRRKHRKACARGWAKATSSAAVEWGEPIDCQDAADEVVREDVSNWND